MTTEEGISTELIECRQCNNMPCKCRLLIQKFEDILELTNQLEFTEMFDIIMTLSLLINHLKIDNNCLYKIHKLCKETYVAINPKNKILN